MKIIKKDRNALIHKGKKVYYKYPYTAKGQIFKNKKAAQYYNNKKNQNESNSN